MDDIYDAYGTFEELQLLTNAIQRLATYIFTHHSILNLKVDSCIKKHYSICLVLNFFSNWLFRWDVDYIDQLPEYTKSLLNFYEEMEEAIIK